MGAELFTMWLRYYYERAKNSKKTERTFMYLPQREKENVWGNEYAVKGKKELSKLCKEYERNPKAKCVLHLPAFIEFSSARPQGTRLCWLAKKNVIKAQPELGQVSSHSLHHTASLASSPRL